MTTADDTGSIAIGNITTASGYGSIALGAELEAIGRYSCTIGKYLRAGPAEHTAVFGYGISNSEQLVNNIENSLMIGFDTTTPTIFIGGEYHRVGIGTAYPGFKLQVGESGDGTEARANAWNTFSSREYKKDITALQPSDYEVVLQKLRELAVVRYHYNGDVADRKLRIGFIAEDAPEEMTSEDGKAMSLSDSMGFLLAAVKAQQEQIGALQEEIRALRSQMSDQQ